MNHHLKNKKMKDQTRVIAALLIGAAAGAALGLLLAPEKGETVRDGIADYINDLVLAAKDKAAATSTDLKQYGSNIYDRAKSKVNDLAGNVSDYKDVAVDAAKAKVQDVKNQAQSKFEEAKSHVKNGSNNVNDAVQNS
jgi:gas vesicle protein